MTTIVTLFCIGGEEWPVMEDDGSEPLQLYATDIEARQARGRRGTIVVPVKIDADVLIRAIEYAEGAVLPPLTRAQVALLAKKRERGARGGR